MEVKVKRSKTPRIVAAAVGGAIFSVALLGWLFGTQVSNWHDARGLARIYPYLELTPQPLPNLAPSQSPGSKLAEFGFEFEAPWIAQQTEQWQGLTVYTFQGNRAVTFWDPANQQGVFEEMKRAVEASHHRFVSFLGARSSYDLLSSALQETPKQISVLTWKSDSARKSVLLTYKQLELGFAAKSSAIYSFTVNGLRCFQYGDPPEERLIEVKCFDSGNHEIQFDFSAMRSPVYIEQQEINHVIQTLHSAPTPPEPAPSKSLPRNMPRSNSRS